MTLKLSADKNYMVTCEATDHELVLSCALANNFCSRLKGLMFRKDMDDEEGLLIIPCNSVHTFFMNFAIDLIFIDSEGKMVSLVRNLKPGKALKPVNGAWGTLELKAGKLDEHGITDSMVGSRLVFKAA